MISANDGIVCVARPSATLIAEYPADTWVPGGMEALKRRVRLCVGDRQWLVVMWSAWTLVLSAAHYQKERRDLTDLQGGPGLATLAQHEDENPL